MGITMYQRCFAIMQEVKSQGYERQIGWPDLALIIRRMAGSKQVTMDAYRKELQILGFLRSRNNLLFDIIGFGDKDEKA